MSVLINKAIIHDYDPILNTISWVKAHDRAQALIEQHSDRVLTIRYEDFLTNQEFENAKTQSIA